MNEWQAAGNMLSGAAAGLQGNSTQFNRNLMAQGELDREEKERQEKRQIERMKTQYTDSAAALDLANQGRWDLVAKMGQTRLDASKNFPEADFSHTQQLTELAQRASQGDAQAQQALTSKLTENVAIGRAVGVLGEGGPKFTSVQKDPATGKLYGQRADTGEIDWLPSAEGFALEGKQGGDYVGREGANLIYREGEKAYTVPIEGYQEDPGAALDRQLRERQIATSEAAEERQATKLSASAEKRLIEAQDTYRATARQANHYSQLADRFDELNNEGGGAAISFREFLKGQLGSEDAVTELRRSFAKVITGEGLKNLPPGPASDKDIEFAMKGFPPPNSPPHIISSFLRGASKIARLDAAYNQFTADFINKNRSPGGALKAWRTPIDAPELGRKISMMEVYETASNKNITPEEVLQRVGIENGPL